MVAHLNNHPRWQMACGVSMRCAVAVSPIDIGLETTRESGSYHHNHHVMALHVRLNSDKPEDT